MGGMQLQWEMLRIWYPLMKGSRGARARVLGAPQQYQTGRCLRTCKTRCTLARVPSVPHLWAEPAECSRQGTENGKGAWMWVGLHGKAQFQLSKHLSVSMRMWLPCPSCHMVADPKSGEAHAGRQHEQRSTPPQGAHKTLQSLSDLIILCKNIYGYS